MNTIIATAETLTNNYRDSRMEFLMAHQDDYNMSEFADDLMDIARDLQQMSTCSINEQLTVFRQAFRDGFTMMMMPEEFDRLETWSRSEQEFRVALFREDGTAIGVIKHTDICW